MKVKSLLVILAVFCLAVSIPVAGAQEMKFSRIGTGGIYYPIGGSTSLSSSA